MLLSGVELPVGVVRMLPSLAHGCPGAMAPKLPGWTVQSVADDVAWLHIGRDGRLHATNPENGFLGEASGRPGGFGTDLKSRPGPCIFPPGIGSIIP